MDLFGGVVFVPMRDGVDHSLSNGEAEIHTGILIESDLLGGFDAEILGAIHTVEIRLEHLIQGSRHDFVKGYQNRAEFSSTGTQRAAVCAGRVAKSAMVDQAPPAAEIHW